eukprot:1346567-Amorphochlora_amoeboformis.AAC.1
MCKILLSLVPLEDPNTTLTPAYTGELRPFALIRDKIIQHIQVPRTIESLRIRVTVRARARVRVRDIGSGKGVGSC